MDVLRGLADNSFDLAVVDPPYFIAIDSSASLEDSVFCFGSIGISSLEEL